VPDPQDEDTYRRSQLDWAERSSPEHARMLQWYRDLIALRRSSAHLTDGRLDAVDVQLDEDAQWLVMARGALRTVVNLSPTPQRVPVGGRSMETLLAWEPRETAEVDGDLALPGHGAAIVRLG
jgi:maltooligosyltrehalose trehalohydrolase